MNEIPSTASTGRDRLSLCVIGLGGIGGHLAPNLCRYLYAGRQAARVTLIDGDAYEERNRERMSFTVAENKAVAKARELATQFGSVLSIEPVAEYVTRENVGNLIGEGDVVFLAVDNHATRKLVDDHCSGLSQVTLISGGNDGVEEGRDGTYGNVQIAWRQGGKALSNSLSRFHSEIRNPADRSPNELGCEAKAQAGAAQLLFTNLAVASAMLNAFYVWQREELRYEEVYIDIRGNRVVSVERRGALS